MNRDDLNRILNGLEITDDMRKAILDINSADITKALGKQSEQLTEARSEITRLTETVNSLEANKNDAEALKTQLEAYREADEKRNKEAAERARRNAIMNRMDAHHSFS